MGRVVRPCSKLQQRPVVFFIVSARLRCKKGFRIRGKPQPCLSRPDSTMTFNFLRVRTAAAANSHPSMPGILMSVIKTSIRLSVESFSKASSAPLAVTTSHPRSCSMASVTSSTSGSSSTTSTTRAKAGSSRLNHKQINGSKRLIVPPNIVFPVLRPSISALRLMDISRYRPIFWNKPVQPPFQIHGTSE